MYLMKKNCIGLAAGLDVRILIYLIADRDRLDTTHADTCGPPAAGRLRGRARARPALDEVFERAGRRRAWRAAEWRCDRSPSAL